MKRVSGAWTTIAYLVLGAVLLSPLLWVGLASLLPEQVLSTGASGMARQLGRASFAHYHNLFELRDFSTPLQNSLYVAGATTLLCLMIGSSAAYALARLDFRGKKWVAGVLLAVSMFPQISIVEPLYALLRELGLVNSYPGLILPYLTFSLPLSVLLLISFFRELPREVEHAAALDGATPLQTFVYVVLPLSLPGLISTSIISFIYSWNEFLFALSFTAGESRQTLPVAIAMLRGRHQIPWGELFAAAVVTAVPVALLILIFQRRIVEALTSGLDR